MKKPRFSVGQSLICDDNGDENPKYFVLGMITDIVYDEQNKVFVYDINWIDSEVNNDVKNLFDECETAKFVKLWRDCIGGRIQDW